MSLFDKIKKGISNKMDGRKEAQRVGRIVQKQEDKDYKDAYNLARKRELKIKAEMDAMKQTHRGAGRDQGGGGFGGVIAGIGAGANNMTEQLIGAPYMRPQKKAPDTAEERERAKYDRQAEDIRRRMMGLSPLKRTKTKKTTSKKTQKKTQKETPKKKATTPKKPKYNQGGWY